MRTLFLERKIKKWDIQIIGHIKNLNDNQWDIIKKEYEYIKENFSDDDGIIEDQSEKSDEIIFNGKSKNNLDHETFVLTKNFREPYYNGDDVKFNFCKTARKL